MAVLTTLNITEKNDNNSLSVTVKVNITQKGVLTTTLSKEDVDRGYDESESIKNQRTLLTEYVQKLGWKYQLKDTYIDQSFTGTNFNRPDFQRMIKDIEKRSGRL